MSPSTRGADSKQGPGWWLASDDKWYPPDLKPGSGSGSSSAKKKKKKKAAPKKAPAKKSPAKKAPAKKAPGKQAPAGKPDAADHDDEHLADRRDAEHWFTPRAPATEQIAVRRQAATAQNQVMAGARQAAALRALSSLGLGDAEPALAGVGGRSLDARSGTLTEVAPPPVTVAPPSTPAPTVPAPAATPPATAPAAADPDPSADDRRAQPGALDRHAPPQDPRATSDLDEVHEAPPRDPAATPDRDESDEAPVEDARATSDREDEDRVAAGAVAPHQPIKGPDPKAAPMGTGVPFMEVKGSALGTDIERIGEKILIFSDRIELRDRSNVVRQTISYDHLADVEVQKKIMGPSLIVTDVDGDTMTAKALRPELASGAKAMIEKHADRFRRGEIVEPLPEDEPAATAEPEPPTEPAAEPAGAEASLPVEAPEAMEPAPILKAQGRPTHAHVLLGMLEELHAAGILDDDELAAKVALVNATIGHG